MSKAFKTWTCIPSSVWGPLKQFATVAVKWSSKSIGSLVVCASFGFSLVAAATARNSFCWLSKYSWLMWPYAISFSMLSRAEQTIFGVLLWQASSNGRKNFSTWTHEGFGSGKTQADTDERVEPGDSDPLTDWLDGSVAVPFGTGVEGFSVDTFSAFKVFKASTHAALNSEWEYLLMSLCCNNFSICFCTYIVIQVWDEFVT